MSRDVQLFKSGFRTGDFERAFDPSRKDHPDEGREAHCLSCNRTFTLVRNGQKRFCGTCKAPTKHT